MKLTVRCSFFFMLLFTFNKADAQPPTVQAGSSFSYKFSDDQPHDNADWVGVNASITSRSSKVVQGIYYYSVSGTWSNVGNGSVKFVEGIYELFGADVTIAGPPPDAGPDRIYCKETGSINLVDWGLDLTDGNWSGSAITNNVIDLAQLSEGTYTYTYTRTFDGASDYMVLTVRQTKAGSLSLCGTFSGTISLTGQQGNVLYWERSYNDGSTWEQISSTATSYSYNETKSAQFQAVVQEGGCSIERTQPVAITQFNGNVTLSNYVQACTTASGTLTYAGDGVVEFWERSYDQGQNWTNVPNQTSSTLLVNETQDVQFRAGVQKGDCPTNLSNVTELKLLKPTTGFLSASQVQFTCGRATGTLTLSGAQGQTITWEQNSGAGWTAIVGAASPYAFDVSIQTSFRVKAESTGCDPLYSNEFTGYVSSQSGTVSSGNGDSQVCGSTTISLNAANYVGSILRWEYSANNSDWTTINNSVGSSSIQTVPPASTNYYRAWVALGSCPAVVTAPVSISVTPPALPGQVVLLSETSAGQGDQLSFTANFKLINSSGSVQNWWKRPDSEFNPVQISDNDIYLYNQIINETTAFSAQVQNGSCDPLVSGKAIFVVNKKSLGTRQLVQGVELSEYLGYSYQVRTTESISLRDGFTFSANSAQDFFVLLDKDYTLPPSDQNFVLEETVLKEGVSEDGVYFLGAFDRASSYSYLDGLDRPLQQVQRRASPLQKDMIVPVTYDQLGRPDKSYLPYEADASDGLYKTSAPDAQASFYQLPPLKVAASSYPFAVKVYEASPLNRVLEQGAPGEDWQPAIGHTAKMNYETNAADEVTVWKVNDAGMPMMAGTYEAGKLFVNITTDEHGNQTKEVKDDQGRVILKCVQNGTDWIKTCYIYDESNLLRYVIQPEGVAQLSGDPDQDFLDKWSFQYKYDYRNRLSEKKVPGGGLVYFIYDKRDRVVLTQDANQKGNYQWSFTKYDVFNRPIISGIYTHDKVVSPDEMTSNISTGQFTESFDGSSAFFGYTNVVFPKDNLDVMTVTYYDNYDFLNLFGNAFVPNPQVLDAQNSDADPSRKGLVTGGQTRVIGKGTWLKSASWYDKRYRVIQTLSENHLGGLDRTSVTYDFAGRVLTKTVTHTKPGDTDIEVAESFQYDHSGRALAQYHQLNNGNKVILVSNQYNSIGQLVEKNLHLKEDGTYAQSVDYRYNIRGFLTHINNAELSDDGGTTNDDANDLFGFELKYNNPSLQGGIAQFNGNISESQWKTLGGNKQSYAYSYDPLNRLKKAGYVDWSNPLNNGKFDEAIGEYDRNGNIKSLTRRNSLIDYMDNLDYTYTGNQLTIVKDAGRKTDGFKDGSNTGDDYTYDVNGNMNQDQNKGLGSITYNYLNLPESVIKGSDNIQYVYAASGAKLTQTATENSKNKTTDYSGSFVYENGVLQFISHAEGRVNMTNGASYEYFLKDHLGSVRMTITSVPTTEENTGTYEPTNANVEQSKFLRYENARTVNATIFDHTNGSGPGYSERLSGSDNEKYGLARSISVMPGDVIKAEVYAKYVDPSGIDNSTTAGQDLLNLLGQITSSATGVVVDGVSYTNSTSSFPAGYGSLLNKTDDGAPKAYLNWLVFDRNYVFQPTLSGFKQITTAARETGTDVLHEYVTSPNITITQPGYVYIYLSNESTTQVEVYFDDFKVTQNNSPVVQQEDFYPFGLKFNSYQRENSVAQNYLYNGKENIYDLGLNWDDYGARMYMPEIGRWGVIDPLSEKMRRWSLYNYSFNNPLRFIDPDGMGPNDVILRGDEAKKAFAQLQAAVQGQMTLTRNEKSGRVTYTKNDPNTKLDENARQLGNAIDDHSVQVQVTANKEETTPMGDELIGGSFQGAWNLTAKDGKKVTVEKQQVNTDHADKMDSYFGTPGATILHEVTEGYQGAKLVQKRGRDSGDSSEPDTVYPAAHAAATDPPPLTVTPLDFNGKVVDNNSPYIGKVEYSMQAPGRKKEVLKTVIRY